MTSKDSIASHQPHRYETTAADDQLDKDGWTALTRAATSGDLPLVRSLIQGGVDLEVPGFARRTALMEAASARCTSAVRILLEAGAQIEAVDQDGRTALIRAVQTGSASTAILLINAGAALDTQDRKGWTALMWAAMGGCTDAVRRLVEAGADIERRDSDLGTAEDLADTMRWADTAAVLCAAREKRMLDAVGTTDRIPERTATRARRRL